MPRIPRNRSATGIYHIVERGVGKQILFENDHDRGFFLRTAAEVIAQEKASLLAWCLMGNHVHLLLSVPGMPGRIMQRINTKYAKYFNERYERTGHLFQNRYRSEAVESERYLQIVVRYIHQNPVREGLCRTCGDYRWSSCREYLTEPEYCTTETVMGAFGGKKQFAEAHGKSVKKAELSREMTGRRIPDDQALYLAEMHLGGNTVSGIRQMEKPQRNKVLRELKRIGLSYRQIQRLTGIGYGIIAHAIGDVD